MVGAGQQPRQMRDHQPDPRDAAADRHLSGDQHRAAHQHPATQPGHRNPQTAGIFLLQRQQVNPPAELKQHHRGAGYR